MTPTPNPVERLIASALTEHAEEAMSQTDTGSELQEVLSRGNDVTIRRRRTWAVGSVVAASLVVSAAMLWQDGPRPGPVVDPASPARPIAPMNADEQLAHDFVSSYFAYDRKLAASYVADGVTPALRRGLGEDGWLRQNRLDEALNADAHIDGCFQIDDPKPDDARIGCLYTVGILGLEEFGRGPFSGNLFNVTLHDGKVVDFLTTVGANDYDELAWGPFWSWIEDTHAPEVPVLQEMDDPDLTPHQVGRMIRHWRQVGRAYVAALRSGFSPPP
jgi:hypothetical protein